MIPLVLFESLIQGKLRNSKLSLLDLLDELLVLILDLLMISHDLLQLGGGLISHQLINLILQFLGSITNLPGLGSGIRDLGTGL